MTIGLWRCNGLFGLITTHRPVTVIYVCLGQVDETSMGRGLSKLLWTCQQTHSFIFNQSTNDETIKRNLRFLQNIFFVITFWQKTMTIIYIQFFIETMIRYYSDLSSTVSWNVVMYTLKSWLSRSSTGSVGTIYKNTDLLESRFQWFHESWSSLSIWE